MNHEFETHPEFFLVLPCVAVTSGVCDDPACGEDHWRVSVGWFIWTFHLYR
jgi:hypothetical protein